MLPSPLKLLKKQGAHVPCRGTAKAAIQQAIIGLQRELAAADDEEEGNSCSYSCLLSTVYNSCSYSCRYCSYSRRPMQ